MESPANSVENSKQLAGAPIIKHMAASIRVQYCGAKQARGRIEKRKTCRSVRCETEQADERSGWRRNVQTGSECGTPGNGRRGWQW